MWKVSSISNDVSGISSENCCCSLIVSRLWVTSCYHQIPIITFFASPIWTWKSFLLGESLKQIWREMREEKVFHTFLLPLSRKFVWELERAIGRIKTLKEYHLSHIIMRILFHLMWGNFWVLVFQKFYWFKKKN